MCSPALHTFEHASLLGTSKKKIKVCESGLQIHCFRSGQGTMSLTLEKFYAVTDSWSPGHLKSRYEAGLPSVRLAVPWELKAGM